MKSTYLVICLLSLVTVACATQQRVVTDPGVSAKPDWVSSAKVTWVEGDSVMFKNQFTIRGDERVNGCYELAKLDAKGNLLREISEDLRGQIDNSQQGLSEHSELALSQVRTSEYGGKVIGLRHVEQYQERYVNGAMERVDCFVLSSIKKVDYDQVKRYVLYKISESDADIKRILKERAIRFFSDEKKSEAVLVVPQTATLTAPVRPAALPAVSTKEQSVSQKVEAE